MKKILIFVPVVIIAAIVFTSCEGLNTEFPVGDLSTAYVDPSYTGYWQEEGSEIKPCNDTLSYLCKEKPFVFELFKRDYYKIEIEKNYYKILTVTEYFKYLNNNPSVYCSDISTDIGYLIKFNNTKIFNAELDDVNSKGKKTYYYLKFEFNNDKAKLYYFELSDEDKKSNLYIQSTEPIDEFNLEGDFNNRRFKSKDAFLQFFKSKMLDDNCWKLAGSYVKLKNK